jgi:hypothetical protein
MPYSASVLVMIASPSDVAGERTVIREVLAEQSSLIVDRSLKNEVFYVTRYEIAELLKP